MPTVMSKFLHMGMPLADVILKSTWAPAQALGRGEDLGTLKKGAAADIFVFELQEGSFPLEDTHLRTESASRRIKPFLTIKEESAWNRAAIQSACGNYTSATLNSSALSSRRRTRPETQRGTMGRIKADG